MKKRIRFIINPISGVVQKSQLPNLIEEYLDHSKFSYDIAITEYRKHAKKIAAISAREGFDIVCAVGGDGSVHEVGTALTGTKTHLAIIPMGSGNGLARHLRIPLDPIEAILCINELNTAIMDTVLVNDKPFLGIGGYGFDALIAKRFDQYHARGFWSYTKLVMREFFSYKSNSIRIQFADGSIVEEKLLLCTLANSSEFGNGFTVSPKSHLSDGKIELVLLKPFPYWHVLRLVYLFFRKKSHLSPYMSYYPIEKARIFLEEPLAHYDGEPFDVRKELNVEVISKSLPILVGKNYNHVY